jgi:hypothetical protein
MPAIRVNRGPDRGYPSDATDSESGARAPRGCDSLAFMNYIRTGAFEECDSLMPPTPPGRRGAEPDEPRASPPPGSAQAAQPLRADAGIILTGSDVSGRCAASESGADARSDTLPAGHKSGLTAAARSHCDVIVMIFSHMQCKYDARRAGRFPDGMAARDHDSVDS